MKKKNKILISLVVVLIIMVTSFVSFSQEKKASADDTWAFYIYLIDDEVSTKYNNDIISEIGHIQFNNNIKVVSETSWGSSFDSFMSYCKGNADADHKVLIIAGEGEGAYGIKKDRYSYITLSEIANGLDKSFIKNEKNPAFDLAIIDGSLMASAETAYMLNGYTKYLVASETLCYNGAGFYRKWFGDFALDTCVSAETLGKNVVNAYMEMVERETKDTGCIIATNMSLIDVKKLSNAYERYKKFAKSAIKRIAKDNTFLSYLSRVIAKTVTAGDTGDTDFYFNMVDFNDLMYNIRKFFPVECIATMKDIKSSIVHKKEIGFITNTCGVSIYFPRHTFAGHEKLLNEYVDNIAKDGYIKALYTYKMNGDIDEETAKFLKKDLKVKLPKIDFRIIDEFEKIVPELNSNMHFTINLPKEMKEVAQDAYLMVYRRVDNKFKIYNQDSYMRFNGTNDLDVLFDATWDSLNDIPLTITLLSKTADYKRYFADVLYKDIQEKLIVNYDENAGIPKIAGIAKNYPASKIVGNIIVPLKNDEGLGILNKKLNLDTDSSIMSLSSMFKYNNNYKIENKILPDGEYTMVVIFEDIRGVIRLSGNILFNIHNGVLDQVVNESELMKK